MTTSEVRRAERTRPLPEGEPPQHEMALGMPYVRALARAGAIPIVLPPLPVEAVPALLAPLRGVCLSRRSGPRSGAYGATPSPDLGPAEPALDVFELEVARVADAAGPADLRHLPRRAGAQRRPRRDAAPAPAGDHRPLDRPPPDRAGLGGDARGARGPDSRLATILGADAPWVNSFHHQAVDRLGAGLRAVAWAPDGTVEGIEDESERFVIGVQWHAETLDAAARTRGSSRRWWPRRYDRLDLAA